VALGEKLAEYCPNVDVSVSMWGGSVEAASANLRLHIEGKGNGENVAIDGGWVGRWKYLRTKIATEDQKSQANKHDK